MSNDDPNINDEPQDSEFDTDPSADEQGESTDPDNAEFDSGTLKDADFDSAEFDSAEFDSAEFDPEKMDDSGTVGESESRDSEEIPIKGESESRESEEIPLVTDDGTSAEPGEDEEDEESEDSEEEVPEPANEWLLATFFSGCGLYLVLALVFSYNKAILLHPTENGDWALATIISPIAFISFMSACLALLSKPRGKQWLLLLPTLGPIVPIALGALSVMWLFSR